MKRIIYQTSGGNVAVIVPSQEALDLYGIEAIAMKDVPAGLPFKIVEDVTIPSDRTFRNAWEVTIAIPDGVGAASDEFPQVAA